MVDSCQELASSFNDHHSLTVFIYVLINFHVFTQVLKNCDSLFLCDPVNIVFGNGMFILKPGTDATGYLFDRLTKGNLYAHHL